MAKTETQNLERIIEIAERVTARENLELVHVEMVGARGSATLRIYIDKPDGVTHEDCAAVSREVSVILDVDDPIPYAYTLEVSSPGLDRGLYKAADYERFAGLRSHIRLSEPVNGQRTFHGRLAGLESAAPAQNDGPVALLPVALLDDEAGTRHRLPLDKITRANVEIEPRIKPQAD
ncbi:MAG: ribosome maturation factor RimP [Blastocatellia bacterium]